MMSKARFVFAAVLLISSWASVYAANPTLTEKFVKEVTLDIGGEFWVDNPIGNIEIIGVDKPGLVVTAVKTIVGVDQAALKDAREQTQLVIAGDQRVRLIRTVLPPIPTRRWWSNVSYTVRVPRTVHVKVMSHTSDHIRVGNIAGNVTVKNVNGEIRLDGVTGASIIDSVNGNIIYDYLVKPQANAQLSTVNGSVMVYLPPDSNFEWVGDSIQGDFFTTMPARVRFNGTSLRAGVNAPGGPTINTASVMQNVFLLKKGTNPSDARSVRTQIVGGPSFVPSPTPARTIRIIQLPYVKGNWIESVNSANIEVGQIDGDARVGVGAGHVQISMVRGSCTILSLGGPIELGDVLGALYASTGAGDIVVGAAREGGVLQTGGGIIRLVYTGGATTLHSGGGDIVVRQASGPIAADTKSGDITLSIDPNEKAQKIEAKTLGGNVVINVTPRFAADVDATIMTSDPDANAIHSDFSGLTIRKDQVGSKTRIHATGKINGGGERMELYATDGDIHLAAQTGNPITSMPPH
jgi:DUF4097 and DUF4098 domain-containing protein YvlB